MPELPATIGPYEVVALLGEGGMGQVFLARDPHSGAEVAVKVIRSELAADPAFRARFAAEVAAARRVPAEVTAAVVAADAAAARPWIATRFLDGPTLAERVRDGGPLPAGELRALAAGLLDALAAVHATGLVHRDLKPSNVLLTTEGPRIIDFGIARAVDGTRLTLTGHLLGTPGFMSPEQAAGTGRAGKASDVFSLGSVLVLAATGVGPFPAPSTPAVLFRILHGEPELGATPEPVRRVAAACLTRDAAARPGAAELRRLLGRPRRQALTLGGAAVLVAAGLGVGVPLLDRGRAAGPAPSPTTRTPIPTTPTPTSLAAPPDRPALAGAATIALGFRGRHVVVGGDRVFVTDVDAGAVAVRDLAGAAVASVPVGRFPESLAISPDGARLYVTLNTAPVQVVALDPATLQAAAPVPLPPGTPTPGVAPDASLVATAGGLAVLDRPTGRLLALDPVSLQVRAEQPVSREAAVRLGVLADGRLLVAAGAAAAGAAGELTVHDPATLAVATTIAGVADPVAVAAIPDGARLFVASSPFATGPDPDIDAVVVIDVPTGRRVTRLASLTGLGALVAAPGWLYVARPLEGRLAAVNTATLEVTDEITLPAVDDLALTPDGRTLYAVSGSTLTVLRAP